MLNHNIALVMSLDNEIKDKGNLFVGGWESIKLIKDQQINAVLSAVWFGCKSLDKNVEHLIIKAEDNPNYEMSKHFEESVKFINDNLKITNVLVHCAAGISRSVCLIIAYMIKIHKIKPQDALMKIQQNRKWANPNDGFKKQLEKYYNEVIEGVQ
ncbi:unnamed protein product [Paramecium sonneborni]|uniref:Dual specificity protein phosphatase n=1 Tax=Paramecium sonneborni TaxID=65129 RepID=A0A8S1Q1K7_9CILI|nr:unnamed protein product [Paramecium sonneborni]